MLKVIVHYFDNIFFIWLCESWKHILCIKYYLIMFLMNCVNKLVLNCNVICSHWWGNCHHTYIVKSTLYPPIKFTCITRQSWLVLFNCVIRYHNVVNFIIDCFMVSINIRQSTIKYTYECVHYDLFQTV